MSETTIGERLRIAREDRFETAQEAAKALGIAYATYAGHENGSRGFTNKSAQRYSEFFRISLEWLMTGRGQMRGRQREEEFLKSYASLSPKAQAAVDALIAALRDQTEEPK